MIRSVHMGNFKAWRETAEVQLAPLTGFFGANSSGKSSLVQLLLLLKQTAESPDRSLVLHMGDDRTLVELGTFADAVFAHDTSRTIDIGVSWTLETPLRAALGIEDGGTPLSVESLDYDLSVAADSVGRMFVKRFSYAFAGFEIGMERRPDGQYDLRLRPRSLDLHRRRGRPANADQTVKCYGFPYAVRAAYERSDILADLQLEFERLFSRIYYLGPLRDQPRRRYTWAGAEPSTMGSRGEEAVSALLASRRRGRHLSLPQHERKMTLEETVAYWLKYLGMVHDFGLEDIGRDANTYRVCVRTEASAEQVLLTDVGFGVSQVLPVLTLCYYVPEGSTVILEHPEIHLHPAVQSGLADVLIHAAQTRRVQVLVESHSEHLLRRLQRRIAEGSLANNEAALWFCDRAEGQSRLYQLNVDPYGVITNWPDSFFGDEFEEIAQTDLAAATRRAAEAR